MIIDRFIASVARAKNNRYLRFTPETDLSVPVLADDIPRLLYAHVPFCEELCPYCSFNRMVFREDLARAYFKSLRKEMELYRDKGYRFRALYVGGGTPTILVDELALTLETARSLFDIGEISVETNPNHLTTEKVKRLKDAGVGRLSVGVQSFDDGILKATERYHKYGSGNEIRERIAATMGIFETLNVDMIFNFPAQTEEILAKDLETIIDLDVDQVTYYPLMVSSSTERIVKKRLGSVDYDRGNDFYMRIAETLSDRYGPSTAWCFSRKTGLIDEYVVNFDEYAGLGSGSIGYLAGSVYANTFDVADYITKIGEGKFPVNARKDCSLQERLLYDFLMKLFGLTIDLEALSRKHGVNASWRLMPEILFFQTIGGLKKNGSIVTLTRKGQYYWVIMMREFFVAVNNFRDYCRSG